MTCRNELRKKISQAYVAAAILKGHCEHPYAEHVLALCRAAEELLRAGETA